MLMALNLFKRLKNVALAPVGTELWGKMRSSAGPIPARIKKVGHNRWSLIIDVKDHQGFPWFFNDRDAIQWALDNAV